MNERGLRGNEKRCAIYLSGGQTKGGESAANETDIACPPTERNGRLQQSASCVRHAHAVVLPPAYAKSNVMYKRGKGGRKTSRIHSDPYGRLAGPSQPADAFRLLRCFFCFPQDVSRQVREQLERNVWATRCRCDCVVTEEARFRQRDPCRIPHGAVLGRRGGVEGDKGGIHREDARSRRQTV